LCTCWVITFLTQHYKYLNSHFYRLPIAEIIALHTHILKMTLEQQLQVIINDAANHGVPTVVVEKAIAPVLRSFAEQLQKTEYYVLQNLENDWILTTITNPQLQQDKRVIYAFTSVRDAANFQQNNSPDLIATPIAIAQLLFRLLSLQQVDSIIVMDNSQNLNRGVEIERQSLSQSVERQIELLRKVPPNIA